MTTVAINTWICVLHLFLCSDGLPEDGIPVPKHVEADTCHELYFMICILLSASVGEYTEITGNA
jgi:hypothetical protein